MPDLDRAGWSMWSYLSGLLDLNLSNNMLKSAEMKHVPAHLTRLDLTSNHLEELPESMTCLVELKYAGLGTNKFQLLPPCIKAWEKCQELILCDNALQVREPLCV
jgi:Leucine-rich repeat (LRR) protein